MKRLSLILMVMLLGATSLWARPGYPLPVDVFQPDGTTVTLLMHGDEFLSFITTTDGYTVIKGDDGFYRYAEKDGTGLKATAVIARNPGSRTAEDIVFLSGMEKDLHGEMSAKGRQWRSMASTLYLTNYENTKRRSRRTLTPGTLSDRIDYNKFNGLVILVNWNDCSFQINDPVNFYQKLTSEKNYTDNSKTVYSYDVKGSVRDYFYANSMGMFDPTFDVKGPITIDFSCQYPCPKKADGTDDPDFNTRMVEILAAVMTEAGKAGVDFSNYDMNNDGVIDMVYLIFAGYGSYVQGNNYKLMWPHANNFNEKYDGIHTYAESYYLVGFNGKKLGRYACSVEIQDYEGDASKHAYPDGIGTMCHEFSHVLGLADHYDIDYKQGGLASTPVDYDVMDNGMNFNQGLSPVGYNAFERHILGFSDATVKPLELAGDYQLAPLNTSNSAYIVKSAKDGEVFYVENRQKQSWDEGLPGHGLLVWRADTSNPSEWIDNKVNITPSTIHFELLGNAPIGSLDLNGATNSLWGGKGAAIDLYNITESDGNVSFTAGKDLYEYVTEDFQSSPLSVNATEVPGKFCQWDLVKAAINDIVYTDLRVAMLAKDGTITSSVIEKGIRTIELKVWNIGVTDIQFYVRTSSDGGTTWTAQKIDNADYVTIDSDVEIHLRFHDIAPGSKIQFYMTGTDDHSVCCIDEILVSFNNTTVGIDAVHSNNAADARSYNIAGQCVDDSYKGLVIKNGKKYLNR